MRGLVIVLLAMGCTEFEDTLPVCLWNDVGAVYEPPSGSPAPPGRECLVVNAPDDAYVSAEPVPACWADELGSKSVTVHAGEPVYRYSHLALDVTPGTFATGWVVCPVEE